ncbi:MAG TPA: X-Pro aminopeptidase [Bacteroidetes bacterium]|nr:X-Pro aminopeptidase [Bacteroidota bacterium]
MRYKALSSTLFIDNRQRLATAIPAKSVAIIQSNPVFPANADAHLPYEPSSYTLWLTGIQQAHTAVVMFPDAPREEWKEMLFIEKSTPLKALWEGERLSKEDARSATGIQSVHFIEDLDSIVHQLSSHAEHLALVINEHDRSNATELILGKKEAASWKARYPLHGIVRLAPILDALRCIKHSVEIDTLSEACAITKEGFMRTLDMVKKGVYEYEVEAAITETFIRNGCGGHAYQPIIAGGKNACVLHYVTNHEQLKDGDLLLMDFGADYAYYSADLSRTIPVNGKFSDRQKELYNACLHVQKECIDIARPGITLQAYQLESKRIMMHALRQVGLVKASDDKEALKESHQYFPHGIGHYLGLDTHDVGSRFAELKPGMVLTVEPGIYVREEGIGIRIENDIVVTMDKPNDLMADIPREVEEIESLMAK